MTMRFVLEVRSRFCALVGPHGLGSFGRAALLATAVFLLAIAALAAAPAASNAAADRFASSQPVAERFDVNVSFAPDVEGWMDDADLPECGDGVDGGLLCTVTGSWSDMLAPLKGTVADSVSGTVGAMSSRCSMTARTNIQFALSLPESPELLPAVDYVDAGGEIALNCAWSVRFGDGSTLVGRLSGSGSLVLVDAAAAMVRLPDGIVIDVVAGTGRYANVVGTGTLGSNISFSLLGESGELPFDFEIVTFGRVARTATPTHAESLDLELRAGRPEARIVTPARVARSQLKSALHAVASPRASCSLSAGRNKRTVDLGTARAGGDGSVRFPAKQLKKLSAGRWTVSASCSGGGSAARASAGVTVTR